MHLFTLIHYLNQLFVILGQDVIQLTFESLIKCVTISKTYK